MDNKEDIQQSLDPNMNPIMAPPHVTLDVSPTKIHPLAVALPFDDEAERNNMGDEPSSMNMEDDEANDLAQKPSNPQGADKRAPDRDQGQSIPEVGAGDPGAGGDSGGTADGGSTGEGGGVSQGGGSTGEGGGASQGGGTGNA
jgi:uncharacterized membrane protein YgcG